MKKVSNIINTLLMKEKEVEVQMAKEVEIIIEKKPSISKTNHFYSKLSISKMINECTNTK
jgi:hypothetical protein